MRIRRVTATGIGLALTISVWVSGAYAQDGAPQQTLDRVEATSPTAVLEMPFNDPVRSADFFNTGATPLQAFNRCVLTGTHGRFCLDGKLFRRFPDPLDASTVTTEFRCADRAMGLNTQKADTCVAPAAGLDGSIVFAGRVGSSYSLIKVFAKPSGGCPSGSSALIGAAGNDNSNYANYCFRTLAANRTAITDVVVVDGNEGADFPLGPGVLALEGKAVVFFGQGAPAIIASGKAAWGLIGSESLQSAVLLQRGDPVENYVLATTNTGRILKKSMASTAPAVPVFNIPAKRVLKPGQGQCSTSPQQYIARSKGELLIVTDLDYCQVFAVTPNANFTALVNVQEGPLGNTHDLTLSTQTTQEAYPPLAPSIAPGISVDLLNCGENEPSCTFTVNNAGEPTAVLSEVVIDENDASSLMTVILIEGLPDCRQIPNDSWCEEKFAEEGQQLPDGRIGQPVIVPAPGFPADPSNPNFDPLHAYLNVAALFPQTVHDMVAPELLPEMLIQGFHRAQPTATPASHFAGFFGITDPNIRFRDNFTFLVDVGELLGSKLGCGGVPPHPNLNVDFITAVSERVGTVAGPNNDAVGEDKEYVDALLNTDCINPTTAKGGGRWSFYAVNLQPTPNGDSVYASLLWSIFDDLESTRAQVLCTTADGDDDPPLSASVCSNLASRWANAKVKLDACIQGSVFPKQSEAINNCNAFVVQLTNYRTTLNGATRFGEDSANRIGEQKGRVEVIFHVYEDHFLPSIPPQGFLDPPEG